MSAGRSTVACSVCGSVLVGFGGGDLPGPGLHACHGCGARLDDEGVVMGIDLEDDGYDFRVGRDDKHS